MSEFNPLTAPQIAAPVPQLVTYAQLTEALQLSRQSIGEMIRDGRLPAPIAFGKSAVRFRADEVNAALERLRASPPAASLQPRGKHIARSKAHQRGAADLL